jgi:LmbE family N-acetylglucosaminyl deacetylase
MKKILLLLTLFTVTCVNAQTPEKWTSGDIHEGVKKLNVLASVLYVAAHPDDENTRLIAYLANYKYANTAYLSMTRGDGGQNLIGPEIRELLGVIRTQELLAARGVDGGQQFFTRANDFGYSKDPNETFKIWDENLVKQDLVYAVRNFKPDVIIARFSTTPGTTHGHHTASAILANEAFDLAADAKAFPEQVKELGTWQANRLLFNTSWWFYGSQEKFDKADKNDKANNQKSEEDVKKIVEKEGYQIEVKDGARRVGDPATLVADSTKVKVELGWKPVYGQLDIIIQHAWEWEKKMTSIRNNTR